MPEAAFIGRTPPSTPDDLVDFGELPAAVNALLQQGVADYRVSKAKAEARFREALTLAPNALPVYFCLYKIYTYQGNLERALDVARAGLDEAARQAGWAADVAAWPVCPLRANDASRFALYTLKALAFIRLKRGEADEARGILRELERLDPFGHVGWPVIRELLRGVS